MSPRDLIKSTRGKFFRVEFVKRDGSKRVMIARTGVQKNLTGKGLAFEPSDYGLMTAYDVQKRAYRMVNLNTLLSFTCGKLSWRKA